MIRSLHCHLATTNKISFWNFEDWKWTVETNQKILYIFVKLQIGDFCTADYFPGFFLFCLQCTEKGAITQPYQ